MKAKNLIIVSGPSKVEYGERGYQYIIYVQYYNNTIFDNQSQSFLCCRFARMSDNIRVSISKLQPDQNSSRELLLGREAAGEEKLLRKVTTVMDILWSSFRRGWTSKIPNTKSQRGKARCTCST